MTDLTRRPCPPCAAGRHEECCVGVCGCIADHVDDSDIVRGFKRLKRGAHPEREAWVKGGWSGPLRAKATVGKALPPRGRSP